MQFVSYGWVPGPTSLSTSLCPFLVPLSAGEVPGVFSDAVLLLLLVGTGGRSGQAAGERVSG